MIMVMALVRDQDVTDIFLPLLPSAIGNLGRINKKVWASVLSEMTLPADGFGR